MRLHGICVVKNEADIITLSLQDASRWFDAIYVYDTGSTDDTWDKVIRLSQSNPRVVPFLKESASFNDNLRARVFNHFKDRAAPGDWWCRLDADEIYPEDPRPVLARVPPHHHVVWSIHLSFYLSSADLKRFRPEDFERPPEMTPALLPKLYRADSSEPRFFRHRPRLQWDSGAWPRHMGVVHPRRIIVKHYQYRSPAQITVRLQTRAQAKAEGWPNFDYIKARIWQETLVNDDMLSLDSGTPYVVDESLLPRHMEPPPRRLVKYLMHSLCFWP